MTDSLQPSHSSKKRLTILPVVATVGFLLLVSISVGVFKTVYKDAIFPGIKIADTAVGGMERLEAIAYIEKTYQLDQSTPILFEVTADAVSENEDGDNDKNHETNAEAKSEDQNDIMPVKTTLQELAVRVAASEAVDQAFAQGRTDTITTNIRQIFEALLGKTTISLTTTFTDQALALQTILEPIQAAVHIPEAIPSAHFLQKDDITSIVVTQGKKGQSLDSTQVEQTVLRRVTDSVLSKKEPNSDQIAIDLSPYIFETGIVLTEEEQALAQTQAQFLAQQNLTLTATWDTDSLSLYPENHPALPELAAIEKKIGGETMLSLISFPAQADAAAIKNLVETWDDAIATPVQEPRFTYDEAKQIVTEFVPPKLGIKLDTEKTISTITTFVDEAIAQTHEQAQKNAEIAARETTAQTDEKAEESQEDEQDQSQLKRAFESQTASLPIIVSEPENTLADLNDFGITELIGRGISHYRGSDANRAFNVNHTAQKINFKLIAPGEEFSFNKTIGEISSNTGFRSAYVIKNGRTELGDGGGVCQVSTTVFRAVLDAGFKISRRLPHSYRVGYYEQGFLPGLDATVYSGEVDFRFINDTDHHVLLYNHVDPKTLTLTTEFYGVWDGRQTEITSHTTWDARPAAPTEYISDPSLPAGKRVQVDWAVGGLRTRVVNQVKDKDGTILREDEFTSNYRPWSAKYLVGV